MTLFLGAGAAVALAAAPRGNANYVAVDHQGRPAITLWMQTGTRMIVFVCYQWHNNGQHLNNAKPITVGSNGAFSYRGPAINDHGRAVKGANLKLTGRFVSRDEAVGTMTAPCMHHQSFTARYAPR